MYIFRKIYARIINKFSPSKNNDEKKVEKKVEKKYKLSNFFKFIFIILIIYLAFYYKNRNAVVTIHSGQLKEIFNNYNVTSIVVENYVNAYLHCSNGNISKIFELGINKYDSFENKINTEFSHINKIPFVYDNKEGYTFSSILSYLLYGYMGFILFNLKTGNSFKSIFKNDAIESTKPDVNIEDVAGIDDTKTEVLDLVEIIMEPEKFKKMGAKIPSGILLEGPPGNGKTMLAKAISGKYKCPFFFISGSDFIQIFVGLGSQKVKDLFAMARKSRPCIVFIDEIDAIGKKRSESRLSSNDERENILNALLVEMDGFENNDGILIIGATNRSDILDKALLRPGRFDRIVKFTMPDIKSREEILMTYIKKMEIEEEKKEQIVKEMSGLTYGFNSAQLANLCNEAIIHAVKNERETIEFSDFEFASDYVLLGPIKKNKKEDKNLDIVANHEIGHALTSFLLDHADPPRKVSIIPRAKGILGFSQNLNTDDKTLYQFDELEHMLMVLMGGRIAEKIKFNNFSTGAYDDLQKINSLIRDMITKYGMDWFMGGMQINLNNKEDFYAQNSNNYLNIIDERIQIYIRHIESKTEKLLRDNIVHFDKLVTILLEKETIYLEEIKEIVKRNIIEI